MSEGNDSEKIGRLLEAVEQMRQDFKEERKVARESRAAVHSRLDAQALEIADLRTDVTVSAQIDAQIRNELQELRNTVNKNHEDFKPDIEEFRRMRNLGRGFLFLLGFGGVSVGAALAYMSDSAVTVIRHWLRIN